MLRGTIKVKEITTAVETYYLRNKSYEADRWLKKGGSIHNLCKNISFSLDNWFWYHWKDSFFFFTAFFFFLAGYNNSDSMILFQGTVFSYLWNVASSGVASTFLCSVLL